MLLFAARETLDGATIDCYDENDEIIPIKVPEFLVNLQDSLTSLKEMCRRVVREHLIVQSPHQHLFHRIPKLGLPSLLEECLMYSMSIEIETKTTD